VGGSHADGSCHQCKVRRPLLCCTVSARPDRYYRSQSPSRILSMSSRANGSESKPNPNPTGAPISDPNSNSSPSPSPSPPSPSSRRRRRRCRKKYCANCLKRFYNLHVSSLSFQDRDNWKCVSCTGCVPVLSAGDTE